MAGAIGDQAVHLLADAAVGGVALRRGAQFDDVHGLARVHVHVEADPIRHRHRIGRHGVESGQGFIQQEKFGPRGEGFWHIYPPAKPVNELAKLYNSDDYGGGFIRFENGAGLPRETTGVFLGNTLTGEFSRANVMRLRWPYVRRVVEASLSDEGWSDEQRASFLKKLEGLYKEPFPTIGAGG